MSINSYFFHWGIISETHWKERARRTRKAVHTSKGLWRQWYVRMWLAQHVQDRYYCWTASARISPLQKASERRNTFGKKISILVVYLIKFNVILKYLRISENLLPTFQPSSRTIMLVEMTLVRFWKKVPKKKDFWLSLEKCYFQAISWRMEQSLHRCCSFIWTWGWFAKKFIASCNTLLWSASKTLFNLRWML